MKYLRLTVLLLPFLASSCSDGDRVNIKAVTGSAGKVPVISKPGLKTVTDTLQLIHFDANADYWYVFFLNRKKDTLRLVTEKQFSDTQLNSLLEVIWKIDTLSEAGEGEKRYTDKRLLSFRKITGKSFVVPVSEQSVLQAVNDLPEVKGNADRFWVTERPTFDRPYFQVESETVNEDNTSRLFSFRVYTYPEYQIKIMDYANDAELPLEVWRKKNN